MRVTIKMDTERTYEVEPGKQAKPIEHFRILNVLDHARELKGVPINTLDLWMRVVMGEPRLNWYAIAYPNGTTLCPYTVLGFKAAGEKTAILQACSLSGALSSEGVFIPALTLNSELLVQDRGNKLLLCLDGGETTELPEKEKTTFDLFFNQLGAPYPYFNHKYETWVTD